MKIIAPVKSVEYLQKYKEAGAEEFYGGILDERWNHEYGQYIEYNRRGSYVQKANCTDWKELEEMVQLALEYGTPFYLTVNALRIVEKQMLILEQILEDYKRIGGEKVIISDISLMKTLNEMGFAVTISSCANIRNQYSAQFMKELGCERIIFPRDIIVEEICEIRERVPEIEYEVFLSNSGCKFSDGNCLGLHGTEMGALCDYCRNSIPEFYKPNGTALSDQKQIYLQEQNHRYNKLFSHACAQCAIYQLKDCADSVKIVGRAANEEKILEDILLTKQNIVIAENCKDNNEYLQRLIRPEDGKWCVDYKNCYYRTDMVKNMGQEDKVEQDYWKFYQNEGIENKKEDIEYLGINLSSEKEEIEFKVYYKDEYSRKEQHPIIEKLETEHMVRTLTQIVNTKNGHCRRYDIGLGNRTNVNMEKLLEEIDVVAPFCSEYKNEIRTLSQMKVCENPNFAFASLYFLGFIEKENTIEAMKMHYLTRICENPDKLGKRVFFDDAYYLDYLEQMNVSQFKELLPIVRSVVNGTDGILWMIGVDYFKRGNHKYKIYFKILSDEYIEKMKAALLIAKGSAKNLVVILEKLEIWQKQHVELVMDGVAVCLDQQGCWSLNFYFKWMK